MFRGKPQLHEIYAFCIKCLDKYQEEEKFTKKKIDKYSISIEKFQFFAEIFQVRKDDLKEALEWVAKVCDACNGAREVSIKAERRRRWGK